MRDETGTSRDPASPRTPSFDSRAADLAVVIEAARRDATMEGRLAAISLTLFPLMTATLLLAFVPNAMADGRGWPILMAAAVLTAAGAWWLWKIARPPFAAFPRRRSILERQPRTAYELSVILQQAAVHAEQGMDVADALDRAAPADVSHPARALAIGLQELLEIEVSTDPDEGADPADQAQEEDPATADRVDRPEDHDGPADVDSGGDASTSDDADDEASRSAADAARTELPDWLISALQRGWADTQPGWTDRDPVQTLHLVAVRMRAELEAAAFAWPGRVRVAALVPFGVCILPAAVLLALLAFL